MRERCRKGTSKADCSGSISPECTGKLEDERIGKKRYCKPCEKEYMRLYREKNKPNQPTDVQEK